MILQKSFYYADMLNTFLLLSLLKTEVLLIFKNHDTFLQDSLLDGKFKRTSFVLKKKIYSNFLNVFIVTFDKCNVSLLNKSIHFFHKRKTLLTPNL